MSSGSASQIDPRFDPRFQRGYVPDAAAPRPGPVPPPAPSAAAPATISAPAPVPAPGADASAAADSATEMLGGLAHAQAERHARADRERDDADPSDGEPADADSPAFTWAVQLEPDAEPVIGASPARWFLIALAACVAFIGVGVALFWNGASDRSMFRGASSGLEGAFNQFSMTLAPGLVQAGVLGAIAVLVAWAITGRRSRREVE